MKKKDKQILKDLRDNLEKSTQSNFHNDGSLSDWVKFARKMNTVINTTIPLMDTLIESQGQDLVETIANYNLLSPDNKKSFLKILELSNKDKK